MGARTDAARAEVLAARGDLGAEIERLGDSAREAVDIPAKVRRAPGRSAALAGGAAFFLLGGPRRVLRGLRRAVRGAEPPLPEAMLPEEIERALRQLGTDGDRVRGTLEREFARYLEATARSRSKRSVEDAVAETTATLIRQVGRRVGFRLLLRLFAADGPELAGAFRAMRQAMPKRRPPVR